ncbi:zinc finger MYM-type protein 1-like isoform X2 [Myzus persicae]|uniref:zinc finger MYM-type protein 1-like isoform X2 n=1 Tax=Myzus persicae TaxID=13164 RepID=UPI000B930B34|nr:zinc finger MYM-type protein 1-like isoform X2 [Myzus persicae]
MSKWSSFKMTLETGSIQNHLNSAHKPKVLDCKIYIKQLIKIAFYLGKQSLSFRGHRKDELSLNRENFKEACVLMNKFNDNFACHFNSKTNYTSWSVQNTIINFCAKHINKLVCDEIKECGFHSIMVDEARSFKAQQLSLCIRYTNNFEVVERFLTFIDVLQKQDASSSCSFIFNYLDTISLLDIPIVAQLYDGANVTSGQFSGVLQKVKLNHPFAIYTHCMTHRVKLVVLDMCKMVVQGSFIFHTFVLEDITNKYSVIAKVFYTRKSCFCYYRCHKNIKR